MKLYHRSPKKLKKLVPKQAKGITNFENQKAIFLCKTFNHAALYAIGKSLKEKTQFAVTPHKIIIAGKEKLKEGYVYEVEVKAKKGERQQYSYGKEIRKFKVTRVLPKDYKDKIIRVKNKEELMKKIELPIKRIEDKMKTKVKVNDKMQKGYTYFKTKPIGKNFHEDFKPQLTPKQMLTLGVFGGVYMRDCKKEFPSSWFTKAKFAPKNEKKHLPELNYFKINASQSLKIWRKKGWIHKDDPRGWFQWYCRYYLGRRHEDDERQIKRWKAFARHLVQVKKNCKAKKDCRIKQRQSLLNWAYDVR